MSTPHTGLAAEAVTIHQSATASMRDLIGRQLEKARVGVFKIPDEAWDAYPVELNMRMAEWLSSEGVQPDPIDLSSYGRIKALCVDADPVALDKFLGAYTAFLMTEFMPVDAANRILLGVQWLYGSASAHQTDVAPLVARKVAEFRKIDAMIQPVQMIPAPVNGPARAKRLILKAVDHGDGWLAASDYNDMTEKLRALFWNDSSADLMEEDIPMFLSRKLTSPDGKRMGADDAEAVGLLLTDGDTVSPLRRLRGVRLDVLKELAVYRGADDLVQLIDGGTVAVGGIRPPAPAEQMPAEQSTERPMTRMALIQKYVRRWPTIESALNNAGRNGLDAAKAGERSWMESKVLEWAYSKGNMENPEIEESPKQANWVQGLGGR